MNIKELLVVALSRAKFCPENGNKLFEKPA